jgi:hypothetical protein
VGAWWTYGLADLLLFSPRVYYRQFELLNEELWPAQLFTLAAGLAILALTLRPPSPATRAIPTALGLLWIWVAWSFLWQRYADINWAAAYVAPLFALQGLGLIWSGSAQRAPLGERSATGPVRWAGVALLAGAVLLYPVLPALFGRPWASAEVFGIAPDPTALATLAVLAGVRWRFRWLLIILPALWCAASGATLWAMMAPDWFVPPLGAAIALALAARASAARPFGERTDEDRG